MNSLRHCTITGVVLLLVLLIPIVRQVALAQSPETAIGINYLKSTQTPDGSWGSTPTSLNGVFPTSTAALEALRALESTPSPNQTDAIQFLTSETIEVTPFLAARIVALTGTDSDTSADLNTLLSQQNPDGGWGTAEGFESDALDTSFALLALKAASLTSISVLTQALRYLTTTQNPDGGWALTKGEDSQVFYTALAVQALNGFRKQFALSTSETRALAFLRGKQNTDGGYGSSPGTPFETALTLLAIFDAGLPLSSAEVNARNFLTGTQQANGSWADDAYSTTLALRALAFPGDSDADGMPDDFETANGLNPVDPSDAGADSDGDRVANLEEFRLGTNPHSSDTDGDGVDDQTEVSSGSDPRDPASVNHLPVITSRPNTSASGEQAYSYQVQASDPDGDTLAFALLQAPSGMSIANGLIEWTPTATQVGSFSVIIRASDGKGGSALQQYRVTVLAEGIDLTVAGVDTSAVTTQAQTLVIGGTVRVDIRNQGGSPFDGGFALLVFEDRNGNGTFENGVDNAVGTGAFSGSIASNAVAPVEVRVSGVVLFHANLLYAFVDSASQIPELDETNNIASSGNESRYQPPAGDFLPKVKWQWETPFHIGILHTPLVAPLIDTNDDGLVDERDVPAVIAVPEGVDAPLAVRGDTGETILPGAPGATRRLFATFHSPAVGDIDGDGRPEIIVAAASGLHCFNNDGTLKWTGAPPRRFSHVTLADLDGDGQSEILHGTSVYNADGSVRFDRQDNLQYLGGSSGGNAAQLAVDLDLDGDLEVIAGPSAYDKDGNRLWAWQRANPSALMGTLDGGATVVIVDSKSALGDAYTAVADLDEDRNPEIIAVSTHPGGITQFVEHSVQIFEHDGRLKADLPLFDHEIAPSFHLGSPTVADVDGDGQPEIALVLARFPTGDIRRPVMQVYEYQADNTLQLKWQRDLLGDFGAAPIPASAFDFDGDGAFEIVVLDSHRLSILNGRDGAPLFEFGVDRANAGFSLARYPSVADVDNDGSADIIVPTILVGNARAGSPPRKGLLAIGDTRDNWLNARRVWNQNRYHITHVDEDAGIPREPRRNWLLFNNHLAQSPIDGLHPLAARDLSASRVTVDSQSCPALAGVTARIGNGGSLQAGPGVRVNFYLGDPAAGGTLIGTRETTRALYPGEFEDITLDWDAPAPGQLFVTVNDPPISSLVQSSNLERLAHTWAQGSGFLLNVTTGFNRLAYNGIDGNLNTHWRERPPGTNFLPTGPTFFEVRFPFPVNATSLRIENNLAPSFNEAFQGTGTLTFSNGFSATFTLDANGEGAAAFPEQPAISWIRLTSTETKANGAALSELIVTGSYSEPQFRVSEATGRGDNNKAAAEFTGSPCDTGANQPPVITSAPPITAEMGIVYSYRVQASDPNNDPLTLVLTTAPAGMTMNAAGLITWTPTAAQTGDFPVSVQVSDGRGGTAQQDFRITVGSPAGVNRAPEITSTPGTSVTLGQAYPYDVTATDPDGDVVLFSLVQSPANAAINLLSGSISWTPTASQAGTQFFTVAAQDGKGGSTLQSFAVEVIPSTTSLPPPPADDDDDGFDVTLDCADSDPDINPGHAEIPGNGRDDDCNPATPDAVSASAVECSLVSDKRSYPSNSLAQLTASLRNLSPDLALTGLETRFTVNDPGAQSVFTTILPVNTLAPQALSKSTVGFDTQTRPPGNYRAAIDVGFGSVVVCQAEASFTILSGAVALSGNISADTTALTQGESATFSYQVHNVGNTGLPALTVKVLVVEVANEVVLQTFTDQTSLNTGQSFSSSKIFNSVGATAGEYLVVLQGEIGATSQTIGSAFLSIQGRDPFLCYRSKSTQRDRCTADAPKNAGCPCVTEKDCGGQGGDDVEETDFCVPRQFPKGLQVSLNDQFEEGLFDVKKPVSLCNPAEVDGGDLVDPGTHLRGYQIKLTEGLCAPGAGQVAGQECLNEEDCGGVQGQTNFCVAQPKSVKQTNLKVMNVLHPNGELVVDTIKPDRLLTPSAKDLEHPVDPPDPVLHNLDHYKCYRVKLSEGAARFPMGLQASVADQFQQSKLYELKKPTRLCTPVDKNGEGIKNTAAHLMCYQAMVVPKTCTAQALLNVGEVCKEEEDCGGTTKGSNFCCPQPQHQRVAGIFVNNQFGPEQVDTLKEEELCVPSTLKDSTTAAFEDEHEPNSPSQ